MLYYWKYLREYKSVLFLVLFLAAVNQVFSLLDPQIFRIIVDKYAGNVSNLSKADFLSGVTLLLGGTITVAFVSRIAKNFQDYFTNAIAQKSGARMYEESIKKSLSMPFAVFEDQRSGELLSKVEQAKTKSQTFIGLAINGLFIPVVGILFVLIYATYVHWSVGLIYAVMLPLIGYVTYHTTRSIKSYQKNITKQSAELAGASTETLRNIEIVKSLGLEGQEISRLSKTNTQILTLELAKIKKTRKISFVQGTLINFLRTSLMFLMLYLIFENIITLGEFFSLLFYSFFLFNPLAELGNIGVAYQETKGALAKLEESLNVPVESEPADAVLFTEFKDLVFKHVSFSYPDGKKALKDINLQITKGQTIAFAGPSGSGKTTVTKLILKLYNSQAGNIILNGTDIHQYASASLRQKVGLVTQENQIFAGTIRDNLLFVKPDASEIEMLDALKGASAVSILDKSDKALDTVIGEGGIKLSGGEKQRLAIARSLLRNPQILIFDEATSSLDSITEEEITTTIKNLKAHNPNLLIILIAHRLSTIRHADNIYILEHGELIEQGNHDQLLESKGLYYALWRQQQAL